MKFSSIFGYILMLSGVSITLAQVEYEDTTVVTDTTVTTVTTITTDIPELEDQDISVELNKFAIISVKNKNNSPESNHPIRPAPTCAAVFIGPTWLITQMRCFSYENNWVSNKVNFFYIHPDYKKNYKTYVKKVYNLPCSKQNNGPRLSLIELNKPLPINVSYTQISNETMLPEQLKNLELFHFSKGNGREFQLSVVKNISISTTLDNNEISTVQEEISSYLTDKSNELLANPLIQIDEFDLSNKLVGLVTKGNEWVANDTLILISPFSEMIMGTMAKSQKNSDN